MIRPFHLIYHEDDNDDTIVHAEFRANDDGVLVVSIINMDTTLFHIDISTTIAIFFIVAVIVVFFFSYDPS